MLARTVGICLLVVLVVVGTSAVLCASLGGWSSTGTFLLATLMLPMLVLGRVLGTMLLAVSPLMLLATTIWLSASAWRRAERARRGT